MLAGSVGFFVAEKSFGLLSRWQGTSLNAAAAGASLVGAALVLIIGSKGDSFASVLVPFTAATSVMTAGDVEILRESRRSFGSISW